MNYIKEAIKTENNDYSKPVKRFNEKEARILHGLMGIVTESGEAMDILKKKFFYGKEIDWINLEEEIGDIFWYCAIICHEMNISFEEIQEKNINKLKIRYPNNFTEKDAINRDLKNERKILETNN